MFVLVFELVVNDLFDERKNEKHQRVADQLHVCTLPFGFNESYLMGVSDCKVYFSPVVQKPN